MRAFNLIPADERGGAAIDTGKSGGGALVVLGVLGVLAVFALLYGSASRQISSQSAQIATLAARTQLAQAQAARLSPYVSFMGLHEQRVQAVDQLVDSRFDWAHAFHEIGRVLPKDASLSSLSGTIGSTAGGSTSSSRTTSSSTAKASSAASSATGAAATTGASSTAAASATVASSTPPGSVPTFTLSGCATSQAEVALTLDHLRLIDGVSEVTLQSSTKSGAGGGGGGAGGCKGSQPAFAMQIVFDPLPTAPTTSSHSTTATASSASALTPSTGPPTTSTGGAR